MLTLWQDPSGGAPQLFSRESAGRPPPLPSRYLFCPLGALERGVGELGSKKLNRALNSRTD